MVGREERAHPLESDRSPRVRLARRDAHLGAKPVPEPVGKARTRIDVHARRVDPARERPRVVVRLGDDAVGVVGRVRVDVGDGGRAGGDGLNGEGEVEKLGRVVLFGRGGHEGREGGVRRD